MTLQEGLHDMGEILLAGIIERNLEQRIDHEREEGMH